MKLRNYIFNEINIGDSASVTRKITLKDIEMFALLTGDINPAHMDEEFAKHDIFHQIVAHGMWGGALISMVLGTKLPGPGTIYLSQTLNFIKPIKVGDEITTTVTVKEKQEEKHIVLLDCTCSNQAKIEAVNGTAKVIAPTEKIIWEPKSLSKVTLEKE